MTTRKKNTLDGRSCAIGRFGTCEAGLGRTHEWIIGGQTVGCINMNYYKARAMEEWCYEWFII